MQKIEDCLFAEDVLYDVSSGVWARFEGPLAVVGVDTVLAWLSGPLTSVSFKAVGTVVERGKSLGSIEGPRHFDTVRSPLTGRVVEVNSALVRDPRLTNHDPYGKGWFAKLEPLDPREMAGMMELSDARPLLRRKVEDLRVRCFAAFPDYEMFEIGSECAGVLVKLDELLATVPVGTVVHLVSDDVTAEVELIAWSERTHYEILETRKEGTLFHFIIKKTR